MAFNDGDTAVVASSIRFYLDLGKTGDFQEICVTELAENLNLNSVTWYDFCGRGTSSTAVTGIDPEWSGTMKIKYNTPTWEFARERFNLENINNVPMKIENDLLNQKVEVDVAVSSFEMPNVAEELQEASFTLKPSGGEPTVTDLVVTP